MPQHLGFESPAQAQTTKIQYFWQTNWAEPSPEPDHKEEGANCEQGKDRRTAAVTCPWHCRPLTIEEFITVSDIVRTRIRMHQHISAECKTQSAVSLEFKKTSLNASDFASTTLPKVCILYVLYCFLRLWSRQRGSQKMELGKIEETLSNAVESMKFRFGTGSFTSVWTSVSLGLIQT